MDRSTTGETAELMPSNGLERLSLATLDRLAPLARPALQRETLTPQILHFGIGAFHRAHQVVYTEQASAMSDNKWGIVDVAPTSEKSVTQMRKQDCLFSVTDKSEVKTSTKVFSSVVNALHMQSDAKIIREFFQNSNITNVTLTVTEKGYYRDSNSGHLKTESLLIRTDLETTASQNPEFATVIGKIAEGLVARHKVSGAPINLISCDNMASNGMALRKVIREFIEFSSWTTRNEVLDWMSSSVAFPSTVVDRIVPPSTDGDRNKLASSLALRDEMAVFPEPFSQWVLEDNFLTARPQWELSGALFVPNAAPYQLMKLRLLNGSHSGLAYVGLACGLTTIDEVLETSWGEILVRKYCAEVSSTLTQNELDIPVYIDSLIERFRNSTMRHQLRVIGSDGSLKLPERWLGSIRELMNQGLSTHFLELFVASWINATRPIGSQYQQYATTDPIAQKLSDSWQGEKSEKKIVQDLLRKIGAKDLAEVDAFVLGITSHLHSLSRGEVRL